MPVHRPRKRFGQHFLVDPGVIDEIIRAVHPRKDDVVVEIGPGQGAITRFLARAAGHLHAIELDRDLVATLSRQYENDPKVSIHSADALSFDFSTLGERLRIVGNLPYNISTPLLFHLLKHRDRIFDMHFMLQKEVVDRMAAGPGSKRYGRLSIMLGCHMNIESLFDVDRGAFDPPPDVTSAIVRLEGLAPDTFDIKDEALLARLVSTAFSKRRKTLRNALKDEVAAEDFDALGIDSGLRPEQIAISDFVALGNHLAGALR